MKIELQLPFSNDYKAGYLLTNKEPRNLVLLVDNNNCKTSISYARYLYSCQVRRYLLKDEHVDHIDNNKLNDVIENLQILSPAQNNSKSQTRFAELKLFICPICNSEFKLSKSKAFGKINPCCSRKCGGIKSSITKSNNKNK